MDNILVLKLPDDFVNGSVIGNVYQYDYGLQIKIDGVELPDTFEVHFSNDSEVGKAKKALGGDNIVTIPDMYLQSGADVFGWIYLHPTQDSGLTEYAFKISVNERPLPDPVEPTPVQQDIITEAIAELNNAVEDVQDIVNGVEQTIDAALQEAKDSGEFDGADGFSPIVSTTAITGGTEITITDKNGAHTFDVMNGDKGDKGDDYVLTENDKQEIANIVESEMPPCASVIKDTATGDICSFSDGADDVPMDSLKVKIEPVQDLHGYDSPWPAGGGKNKFHLTATSAESNGVTFTVNADGTVSTSGTATGTAVFRQYMTPADLPQGENLILNGCPANGAFSSTYGMALCNSTGSTLGGNTDGGNGAEYTASQLENLGQLQIVVRSGVNSNGLIFKPMIRLASVTDATYVLYSNICPITGWTGANVGACGKNLLDPGTNGSINGITKTVNADGSITFSGTATATTDFYFNGTTSSGTVLGIPEGTYHCLGSENGSIQTYRFFCIYIKGGTTYYANGADHTAITIDRTTTVRLFFRVYNGTTINITERLAFYAGSYQSNEQWQPYKTKLTSNPLPISWQSEAGTVYGGELDVVTGELTVGKASKDLGTLNWSISSLGGGRVYATLPNAKIGATGSASANSIISSNYVSAVWDSSDFCISIFTQANLTTLVRVRDSSLDGYTSTQIRSAMSGVQAVYELETPQTYHLIPHEVRTLLGQNNIWADTGDVTCEYSADTKLYIDKKIAEIVNQSTAQTLSSPRLQTMMSPQINLEPTEEAEVTANEFSE